MANLKFDKESTALLVIDPYNDFISEGGKLWDRLRGVAEANGCVPNMLQVLNAARKAKLRVFYALHHRYRPGDYETWKYIAPVQSAAWRGKTFAYGTWGGEIRRERWAEGRLVERSIARASGDPPGSVVVRFSPGATRASRPAHVELENGWYGYRLEIDTLSSEELVCPR